MTQVVAAATKMNPAATQTKPAATQITKLLRKANYTSSTGTGSSCISAATSCVAAGTTCVAAATSCFFQLARKATIEKPPYISEAEVIPVGPPLSLSMRRITCLANTRFPNSLSSSLLGVVLM